jgi:hypothetical protein
MTLLYLFDASTDLDPVFRSWSFKPYGKQRGAWCRDFDSRHTDEAREIEYELQGVGLNPRWRDDDHG